MCAHLPGDIIGVFQCRAVRLPAVAQEVIVLVLKEVLEDIREHIAAQAHAAQPNEHCMIWSGDGEQRHFVALPLHAVWPPFAVCTGTEVFQMASRETRWPDSVLCC